VAGGGAEVSIRWRKIDLHFHAVSQVIVTTAQNTAERQHDTQRKNQFVNSVFTLSISELGIHVKETLRRNVENARQMLSVTYISLGWKIIGIPNTNK
jgi:hypothetical protein